MKHSLKPKTKTALAAAILAMTLGATPSPAAEKPQMIVLTAGDVTSCTGDELARAKATAKVLKREITAARAAGIPVKVFILGDLAYDQGTQENYKCFDAAWGKMLRASLGNPARDILPVPGNHDYGTPNAKWFYRYFAGNAWVGTQGRSKFYESVLTKGWRAFGLNSEIAATRGSPQQTWLKNRLKSASERCIIGLWHKPVFSSGNHGHDESTDLANALPTKQTETQALEAPLLARGASIVLNGHDHHYEELAPHNSLGVAAPDGIRSFIVGTAGRALYQRFDKTWAFSTVYDTSNYGILKLNLFPGRYSYAFLPTGLNAPPLYAGAASCNVRK